MVASLPILALSGTRTGLGRGLAELFLGRGWIVEGCSRGESSIVHERYSHTQVDVSVEREVHLWIRSVGRNRGRLDAVVANAGCVPRPALVAGSGGSQLTQALAVNAGGVASLLGASARIMIRQRYGSMVAISSMATSVLQPGTAAYSASKAAMEAWVKVLAREVSPAGVRCNMVAPSMVETDGLANLDARGRDLAMSSLAISRSLTIAEVGDVVEFLLSNGARAISGHVIYLGLIP